MPIYEYRCSACGHQQEFLQKLSDPPHTRCTKCGEESFAKMVTAAGFQLKGSGWYATDFKGGSKPKSDGDGAKADAKPDAKSDAPAATESKGGDKSDAAAAPAAASTGCGSGCSCH